MEEEHKLLSLPPVDHEDLNFSKVKDDKEIEWESNSGIELGSQSDTKDHYPENVSSGAGASSELNKLTDSLKSMDIVNKTCQDTGTSCCNFSTSIFKKNSSTQVLPFFFL